MKFADFVCFEAIVADLSSKDRDGVIKELVQALVDQKKIKSADVDAVVKTILTRERQGSTGFGKGVSVPHAKHEGVTKMIATIGQSREGVDFAALDRAPVYSIFLLLSPTDQPEQHLAAMEKIFRHLQQDQFRSFLRQAETRQAIADLINEAD